MFSSSDGAEHHRAGAVAEQHARRAIGVVDDARHHVGADHERVLGAARRDDRVADRQRVRKGGTRRRQIETPRLVRANLRLHQARGARKQHVGRDRADDDHVDVVRRQPGLLDRLLRRFGREIARRDARIDDVALLDAGALQDPFVGGLDHLLEIRIGQQLRRHIGGQALDLDAADVQNNPLPGTVRPKYSYARAVASRPRGVRSRKPLWIRYGS